MWFLQTDILIRIVIACLLAAAALFAAGRFMKQHLVVKSLLIVDILLIFYVSKRLCVFYIGYVLVTYLFVLLIRRVKRARKLLFVLCCLGCTVPFFYTRATAFFPLLPYGLTMVGISYNMLKAIDAIYYAYYTGERIPFLTYANFILFFPVITAGPIFRYRDFHATFNEPEILNAEKLENYVKRFIRGMFKKVVVLALVTKLMNYFAQAGAHWYLSASLAVLSYSMLYLDMSGYADIAISLGGIAGLKVPENFRRPLQAASFTMFWRNWHITLSDWIREHIFVVFAGKKLNRAQGALIGFFTMFFMLMWHGFSLAYAIDGVVLGLIMGGEYIFGISTVNRRRMKKPVYILRCFLTNAIFALNSLLLTLGPETAAQVFRGFLKW
ncbi:MAG: MBOAT family O-acyltransferase [Oscillospiraceae bacterium]|jgi:alginate O-acetyltransferase complex protein AlgI